MEGKGYGAQCGFFLSQKTLASLAKSSLFYGGRYKASVCECAYRMMRGCTSTNKVGQHIVHGANAFGIHVARVPCRRRFDRWRVEGGEWAKECAALAFAQAKKSSKDFAMCIGRDATSKEAWHFQCNSGHAIDESGGRRWIHAISQCPFTHNKTAIIQSELTYQAIDELHTLSRGIVRKGDIPSRMTDTSANELASNRAEGAKIRPPCLAHCQHKTSRPCLLPTYTDERCVDCVCGAWDPPLEAQAIKGKRKKHLGKPCIISLAPPLSPPVVVPLIEPQESTPLVVVGFFG